MLWWRVCVGKLLVRKYFLFEQRWKKLNNIKIMTSNEGIKKQEIQHLFSYLFTHWYYCLFYFFLSTRFSLSLTLSQSLVFTSFNKKITDMLLHFLLHSQISNDFNSLFFVLSLELSVLSCLSQFWSFGSEFILLLVSASITP